MTRVAVNGIELNVEVAGTGPALMLLHGFTGDVSTWEPFLEVWSGFTTVRVDLIGHGGSGCPDDPGRYSMQRAVDDLGGVLDHLGIDETALLGYSLGGRVALHFALARPERLWGLILESASPGIEDEQERARRAGADNALADSLLRDGIEPFVDRWQAQPLFESQSRLPAAVQGRQRRQRLGQSPPGLANSLRGMGAGRQEYLLSRLPGLSVPTLLLAGAIDGRYVSLLRLMEAALPDVSIDIVPDAGHAAHLEQPARFGRAVKAFLALVYGEKLNKLHLEHGHR
jgi:2-succinyl-6-hydroxy-2,4-cyclohexadiene-1-carboxylate synthase